MTDLTGSLFLESALYRFKALKSLGESALKQLNEKNLLWRYNKETNSIAVIVQHFHGNMLSRWTDFLTTDGDKPTRDRDGEFTEPDSISKEEVNRLWEEGWECCLETLESLLVDDLNKEVTIRGQPMNVIDAIERHLSHYSYHVGQIIHIAKEQLGETWQTLSIPRGCSKNYKPPKRD